MSVHDLPDSHVVEPAEVLAGLEARFGDAAPRIVDHGDRRDVMFVPATGVRGLPPARLGFAGYRLEGPLAIDPAAQLKPEPEDPAHPAVVDLSRGGYDVVRPGIADPALRIADQDLDGVRAEVLYPSMFFSLRPARPCGRRGRLRQLQRLVGRLLLGQSPSVDRCRAAADARPGHCARAPHGTRGAGANSIATYAAAASVIQATVAELICQGVAARHPDLTFVVSEFNAGWLPNWLERLDQGWLRDPPAADPAVDRRPSSYWATNFKVTIEDDRSAVATLYDL